VPACAKCNNGSSVEDEEFKVLIGISTGEHHENPAIVIDWIARTVGNNQKIANQIFSTKQHVYARLHSSVLEPAISVTFDGEKYSKVISRIVRGLYWLQKGHALGCQPRITVFPTQGMKPDFAKSMMELMSCLEAHALNKGTFVYKVQFFEDGTSIWGVQFFKKHLVFAYVESPEE